MDEARQADLLSTYLDALLAGEPLPEAPPAEIAHLLPVAQGLAALAPAPRPEFGPALKASWLGPAADGGRAVGARGTILLAIVLGLLALAATLILLLGAVTLGLTRSPFEGLPSPTPLPSPTRPAFLPATRPPALPTPAPAATPPGEAGETSSSPTVTATAVIDVLPPLTVTVEPPGGLPSPPDLAPGQPDSADDRGGGDHHHRDDDDD